MAKSTETITLDDGQQQAAEEILQRVRDGDVESPEDILEDWTSADERYDYEEVREYVFENVDGELPRQREYVPVSEIVGSTHDGIKLRRSRLTGTLNRLLSGEYRSEPDRPPKLEKIGDEYYVSLDGHHRVILFKALGIGEIYVEFIETPLP